MASKRTLSFIVLMFVVGLNLRPALSSVAPLLNRLQENAGLSPAAAGLLTTLPVLSLGLAAPLAPLLSRRLGAERALSAALALLTAALLLRPVPLAGVLFIATALAGASIGIAGTLLPGLVKRELPQSADLLTGLYTMALCLGGALGAGLSVPLANALGGWPLSLASWGLLAFVSLTLWVSFAPKPTASVQSATASASLSALLRQPLTWQIMLYMGLQSSMAYIVFGWLPSLLIYRGYGESEAGFIMAVSIVCQLGSALCAPWLARLGRDQRPALFIMLTATALGLFLLMIAPLGWRWLGALSLGVGQGGCFSLALGLLVLRSANAGLAGKLSGLVQGGGYTIAATGPFGVGLLLQVGARIEHIAWLLLALIGVCFVFAHLAGRNRQLDDAGGRLHVTRQDMR